MNNLTLAVSPGNAADPTSPDHRVSTARQIVPLGVYVHFPFCLVKCPYCDFVAYRKKPERIEHAAYADAVLAEFGARLEQLERRADYTLVSVFFGGGTPSLWEAPQVGRVLAGIRDAFDRQAAALEVSIECDPAAFNEDRARALVDVGVTRTSIGLQSFDDDRLRFLGRAHVGDQSKRALEDAVRARVPQVAADVMYGVAGGSAESAAEDVARAVRLGADHISAYSLTIEPRTVFGRLAEQKRLPLADESHVADAFFSIDRALGSRGFEHYEVSNYARTGHQSIHNINYWMGGEYLGLGAGAVGMVRYGPGWVRYRNEANPTRYVQLGREGAKSLGNLSIESEEIDGATRFRERIMLGLRMASGLDLAEAAESCGLGSFGVGREAQIAKLVARGRILREGDRLRIPKDAWIWADGTAASLF